MGKYRLGWPDLLLILGLVAALNGYFYTAMGLLVLYALLYRRATVRRRLDLAERNRWREMAAQPLDGPAPFKPFTVEDIARMYDIPYNVIRDLPTHPKDERRGR